MSAYACKYCKSLTAKYGVKEAKTRVIKEIMDIAKFLSKVLVPIVVTLVSFTKLPGVGAAQANTLEFGILFFPLRL